MRLFGTAVEIDMACCNQSSASADSLVSPSKSFIMVNASMQVSEVFVAQTRSSSPVTRIVCKVGALSLPLPRRSPRRRATYSSGVIARTATEGLNSLTTAQPPSANAAVITINQRQRDARSICLTIESCVPALQNHYLKRTEHCP